MAGHLEKFIRQVDAILVFEGEDLVKPWKDKKVVIVLPNLGLGGAQRQALLLQRHLEDRGASVVVVMTDTNWISEGRHYKLSPRDIRIARRSAPLEAAVLGLAGLLWFLLSPLTNRLFAEPPGITRKFTFSLLFSSKIRDSRARNYVRTFPGAGVSVIGLRRILMREKPEVVLSFLTKTNLTALAASLDLTGCRPVFAVSERNDVCRQPHIDGIVEHRLKLYPTADLVLANSKHAVEDLKTMFSRPEALWLPNLGMKGLRCQASPQSTTVCYAGRFHSSKRVDWIIEGFHRSTLPSAGWKLVLVGAGPEKRYLDDLIKAKGMQECVEISSPVGSWWRKPPTPAMVVLASDFEGSSNFFAEALEIGSLPIVRSTLEEASTILGPSLFSKISFSSVSQLGERLEEFGTNVQSRIDTAQSAAASLSLHRKRELAQLDETLAYVLQHIDEKTS